MKIVLKALFLILFIPLATIFGALFILPFCKRPMPAGRNWTRWYAWYPIVDYNRNLLWWQPVWRHRNERGVMIYNKTPHYGVVGDK